MNTEATPREVGLSEGLGALPEPALHMVADENGVSVYPAFYTADQMRAYAAAAVAAERERCAHWTSLHDHEGFAHHCIVNGREIGA